ncbi:MAG: dihydrodipicolinate synthase family protein [bacterium]
MSPLKGVVVPAITPVDAQDSVDCEAFGRGLERLVSSGVHGIFVGGSAGEGPLLTGSEWRRMVETAHGVVGGRLPLLGGVMDTSTRRVLDKVAVLRKLGYRYAVLTPTFYLTTAAASEHLRLFAAAREAAGDMELVAYNIPSCTGSVLAPDTVLELARRGWVRCCKDSSGDLPAVMDLIRRGRELGLSVLAGDERTAGETLLAGAAGIVPVCANYEPETFVALYKAGTSGDRETVERLVRRVAELRNALLLAGPCWISGLKYAVSQLGIGSGAVVSPLEPANEAQRLAVRKLMTEAD